MTKQELRARMSIGCPGIDEADVPAWIAFGAEMPRERHVEIPLETSA